MSRLAVAATGRDGPTRRNSSSQELGQVFTPRPVADWMAAWACRDQPGRILDPALGRGVFVDAVVGLSRGGRIKHPSRIDTFEVDDRLIEQFSAPPGIDVRGRAVDFVRATIRSKYDAILANPPYIRHHEMDYGESIWRAFDRLCGPGRRVNRATNLYGLFLIKIWSLLAPGGRAAVITPAEWLNADFGVAIKAFLLNENAIDGIVHFDHTASVFDGVLTTAAIALLRRGRRAGEPIRLLSIENVARLQEASLEDGRSVRPTQLTPEQKWTPLFAAEAPLKRVKRPVLGEIARCTRGIATGANDYFTLRDSERRRWKIDMRDVTECITSADQIRNNEISQRDVRRLIDQDERVLLLRPREPLSRAVKTYLEVGIDRGVHRRYLPSHRPVWYMPEARRPAPILVSVFARGDFRFVWNRAGVLNLTAYHGVYPHDPATFPTRPLMYYLCAKDGQTELRHHCRVYADGLLKVEPRDVEALPIPDELVSCRGAETRR